MGQVRVLTGYNEAFHPIAELSLPHLREWTARQGYDFTLSTEMNAEPSHPAWAKIALIKAALESDADFVVWIDIDTLIVRLDQDICDCISDRADLAIAWHGPDVGRIDGERFVSHYNSGVMLIRNCDWSRNFFARVWDRRVAFGHPWWDQAQILWLLGYRECLALGADIADVPDRAHVERLDCAWNSIPGVIMADDPIIHHYAGLGFDRRLTLMTADASSLEFRRASDESRLKMSIQLSLWAADARRLDVAFTKIADLEDLTAKLLCRPPKTNGFLSKPASLSTSIMRSRISRFVLRMLRSLSRAPRKLFTMLPRALYSRIYRVLR